MKRRTLVIVSIFLIVSIAGLSQIFRKSMITNSKENLKDKIENKNNKAKELKKIMSQENLTGTWYWESSNGKNNVELYLQQNGNLVTGKHCSSFYEGLKLDCVAEDDENSITLSMVSTNVYEGNLISAFSDISVPIRITLNPTNETIIFHQISHPIGEYYLPDDVTMTLAQE